MALLNCIDPHYRHSYSALKQPLIQFSLIHFGSEVDGTELHWLSAQTLPNSGTEPVQTS